MGKTRDLFKKIGHTKRTFQERMGMIKDRNSKDLTTEAEEEARILEWVATPSSRGSSQPRD